MDYTLYGYWRSSASYRVRIALNLKELPYRYVPVHLVNEGGEQFKDSYTQLNPTHLVPTLVNESADIILNQSLSIIEYLDEKHPDVSPLLPADPSSRSRVRALAQDIACDVQPLVNLRVVQATNEQFGADDEKKTAWIRHWIDKGFTAIEKKLQTQAGRYCFDFDVTLADVVLIPQIYSAERFGVDVSKYTLISKINENCLKLSPFELAKPEIQPDAPKV